MATGIKEGIGVTVTFATSSITLNMLDITLDGASVADIATFDQATTGYKTYVASTLIEGGTVTVNCNLNAYDHNALFGAIGVSQTITFTLPKVVSTDTTAPAYSFTGYINSVGESSAIEDLSKCPIKIKVADDITFTDGAA